MWAELKRTFALRNDPKSVIEDPYNSADNPVLRGNQAGPIQRGRPCFITPPAARSAGRASQRKPDSSGYLPPAEG